MSTETANAPLTPPNTKPWLILAWSAALVWFLAQTLWRALSVEGGVDFGKHWIAARVMMTGGSPYEGELFLSFNYPLFIGFVYWPLGWFTERQAEIIFDCLNCLWVLLGALSLGLLLAPPVPGAPGPRPPTDGSHESALRALRHDARRIRRSIALVWGPLVLFIMGSSQSLQRLIWSGNVDGLNVLMLCLFAVCFLRGWDKRAGVALACLPLIKVAPILFFLPVAALGRWRVLITACAMLALYWIFLLITGWSAVEPTLYTRVLPAIPYFWKHISVGFHTSLVEAFIGWENITEAQYRRLVLAMNMTMMVMLCTLCWLNWNRLCSSPARLLIVSYQSFLAFSPLLEMIHVSWALPALIIGLGEWVRSRVRATPFLIWLLVWLTVLSLDTYGQQLAQTIQLGLHPHLVKTCFLLLFIASSLWLGFSRPPDEVTSDFVTLTPTDASLVPPSSSVRSKPKGTR
jgi:hypothetical protein